MRNDPYDTSLQWMPQQRQVFEGTYRSLPPTYPEGRLRPAPPPQRSIGRMSKEEALEVVSSLKKYIVVGSLLSFGAVSMLVLSQFNSNANTVPGNQPSQAPSAPSVQDPSSSTSPSDSGGFFNQQGGYGFGSGGSSSAPFTHSHVS